MRIQSLLLLILIFVSCKTENNTIKKNNIIDIIPEQNKLVFSDYFNDFKIIHFKQVLLGDIQKIIPVNNKIIVFAKSDEYNIHVFNGKGELLNSFAKIGNGPEEYISISDINIFQGSIYLIDNIKKILVKYSMEGNFQDRIELPDNYESFAFIDSLNVALYNEAVDTKNEWHINIYNINKNKVIERFLPMSNVCNERIFSQRYTLYSVNDTVCFFRIFLNHTYSILADQLNERYTFNFHNNKIPSKIYNDNNLQLMDFVNYCRNSNYIWVMDDFLEDNRHIYFAFRQGSKLYYTLYNKDLNSSKVFDSLFDDLLTKIDTSLTELFFPISIADNKMYFLLEPYFEDYFDNVQSLQYEEDKKSPNYYFKDTTSDKNQILIIYNFKI